jgi:hypothetical protein
MDKDHTITGSDGNPVAPSPQLLDRTRQRLWRHNGALAPLGARAARHAHDHRASLSPHGGEVQ